VVIHVKAYPVFVSDTTIPDVGRPLPRWSSTAGGPRAGGAAAPGVGEARLRLAAPPLWTSGRFLWEMSPAMRQVIAGRASRSSRAMSTTGAWSRRRVGRARLVAEAVRTFPGPIVALRSIKSDALAGVDPARLRALDGEDAGWRTTGRYGVIQFAGAPAR